MIRVKVVTKNHGARDWLRQIPGGKGETGGCRFFFEAFSSKYDWLLVYDDFPKKRDGVPYNYEELACPKENTILVTSEPSSIKLYEPAYVKQFGHVITSQEAWALKHPRVVRAPSTSLWFYGQGGDSVRTVDDMKTAIPEKSRLISTVCSSKAQKHTLHHKRWRFTQALKERLPELDIYGHGVRPMADKAEAMDAYRYHIAIENHLAPHHWTEKLADCFLAGCLPFYYGCPNAEEYFPSESFIRIDLEDVEASVEIIRKAIQNSTYESRLEYIQEARRRVMEEHNLFARVSGLIREEPSLGAGATGARLYSRHAARLRSPLGSLPTLIRKNYGILRKVLRVNG